MFSFMDLIFLVFGDEMLLFTYVGLKHVVLLIASVLLQL